MTRISGPYSQAELERMAVLTAEGMPMTWIAEDLRRTITSVQRKSSQMPGAAERNVDWHEVWPSIMHNKVLLELHQQIAPSGTRYSW